MKSTFFEVPFIVKFFILAMMIWGASLIQKSRSSSFSSSSVKGSLVKKDSIFTSTSVPVPIFVLPQSKTVSQKINN